MTVLALGAIGIGSAHAEDPATIILPTPVVSAIAQYLAQRPFAEVEQIIGALRGCITAQVPNAQGVTVSHGECPAVTAAMAPKPAPTPTPTTPTEGK
jgi:hypothetical protein